MKTDWERSVRGDYDLTLEAFKLAFSRRDPSISPWMAIAAATMASAQAAPPCFELIDPKFELLVLSTPEYDRGPSMDELEIYARKFRWALEGAPQPMDARYGAMLMPARVGLEIANGVLLRGTGYAWQSESRVLTDSVYAIACFESSAEEVRALRSRPQIGESKVPEFQITAARDRVAGALDELLRGDLRRAIASRRSELERLTRAPGAVRPSMIASAAVGAVAGVLGTLLVKRM